MLKLYIGNKNYSSWSMRPWVLMKQAGIAFEEVKLRFDSFSGDSQFKQRLGKVSPAGKVPVLTDGELVVWDTLAIAEYLAEKYPELHLWPRETPARARARSVCAEMRSGFSALLRNLYWRQTSRPACPRPAPSSGATMPSCAARWPASSRCGRNCWACTAGRCCSGASRWPTPSTPRW